MTDGTESTPPEQPGPQPDPESEIRPDEFVDGPLRGWTYAVLDLLRTAALIVVIFFVTRSFIVEAFKIPTSSMEGTLLAGDFLLVNKAAYGAVIPGLGISLPALAEPHRGEVIVFRPPHEPAKHYVKRLLGLPGDTLEMKDKQLFLNGDAVDEPYARHSDIDGDAVHPSMDWQVQYLRKGAPRSTYKPTRDNWGPLVIPERRFFVLGDNRDNSEDSRYWGFVSRTDLEGRPWFVYYSSEPAGVDGFSILRHIRWERIGGLIR